MKKVFREEIKYQQQRLEWRETDPPISDLFTDKEYQNIGDSLLRIRKRLEKLTITFDINGPDYDDISGSFRVTVDDGKYTGTFASVNFKAAICGALKVLERTIEENKIQTIEITDTVEFTRIDVPKKVSATSIKI